MSGAGEWLFRDRRTGRITIAQAPNLPLAIAGAAWLVRWLLSPSGRPLTTVNVVFTGALAWWAVDQVLRGVNPFRRMLGGAVLVVLGINLIR